MSPALLVNENFPQPVTAALRAKGMDVMAVGECCAGFEDMRVMALAVETQRWLITFDRDYGNLIYLHGLPPPPTVIYLRARSYQPDEPALWIERIVENAEEHAGKYIVFDEGTLRIRPLRAVKQ